MINLKDLKLNDLVKIALTATAIIALTFNVAISSNNTTIINNYIEESNKKLDVIQKTTEDQQSNITKVKSDLNRSLIISEEILEEVD